MARLPRKSNMLACVGTRGEEEEDAVCVCMCVDIRDRVMCVLKKWDSRCSWNESLRPWRAGAVGCLKTCVPWTTFRQHVVPLPVVGLGSFFFHFAPSSQTRRYVNDQEFGANLKENVIFSA